ncbi:MAG: hypothetical protein AAGI46_06340 [Planctomycetota bacterium]
MPRHVVAKALHETQWLIVNASEADVRCVRDALGDAGNRVDQTKAAELHGILDHTEGPAVVVVVQSSGTRALTGHQVPAPLIVVDTEPSLDRAIAAVRTGAADYLPGKLSDIPRLRQRLRHAAMKAAVDEHSEHRLARLRRAVHQLNIARRTVSQRVDLLCNDFIDGYGDVAREVEHVRQTSHLRKLFDSAADLEQLLCHAMDWTLRHAGDCNIAIFLDNDAGEAELAAYMKHTVPGDDDVVDWLRDHVIPRAANGVSAKPVTVSPEEVLPKIDPLDEEQVALMDHAFVAVPCRYLGESLGTILAFRRDDEPLNDEHVRLLGLVGETFATVITSIVRREEDELADDEDDEDEDDWWRTGEAAPF